MFGCTTFENTDVLQTVQNGQESNSKFSLNLSSKTGNNLHSSIHLDGAGINDMAFDPRGQKVAVACRDGVLRIVDWAAGQTLAGFQVVGLSACVGIHTCQLTE